MGRLPPQRRKASGIVSEDTFWGQPSGLSNIEKQGKSFMNLGAVLLITSARHFVMGSPCIIPFDDSNLLRGRDHYHSHLQRRVQLPWLQSPRWPGSWTWTQTQVCWLKGCYYPLTLWFPCQGGSTTVETHRCFQTCPLTWPSPEPWVMGSRDCGWNRRPLRGTAKELWYQLWLHNASAWTEKWLGDFIAHVLHPRNHATCYTHIPSLRFYNTETLI